MAAAAKLLIDIAADIAKLRTDFNEAGQVINRFGQHVEAVGSKIKGALGALGVGFSLEGLRRLIDSVADIGEQADKVQLSTDSFQALTAALRDAGVTAETTISLLARGSQTLGKAFDGNKESVELMRRLGVGLLDAKGNAASFEQTLPRVAQAILDIENPMQRASAAAAFFGGKVGKEAIPALEEMAKGTERLKAAYAAEIVPEATIRRFDQLSDALKSLAKQQLVQIADFLNRGFSPEVIESIRQATAAWQEFFKTLQEAVGGGAGWWSSLDKILQTTAEEAKGIANAFSAATEAIKNFRIQSGQGGLEITITNPNQVGGRGAAPNTEPPPGSLTPPGSGGFTGFPAIKTDGVDKFKEAMTRLKAETEATQLALNRFNEAMASGLPRSEAERQAKLLADIGIKQAQMIKGVEDAGQQGQIKKAVEELEQLKAKFEDVKATQKLADEINSKYGDGVDDLRDRTFQLNKAYDAGKISLEEYNAALKDATEAAERQKLVHEGLKEGLEGISAGFQFAALSMSQSQTDFKAGQDLFNAGFQTISQAITEFADKGTIDFARLSKAFAAMLIEMAVRWAAMSFLKGLGGIFNGFTGNPAAGTGVAAGSTPIFEPSIISLPGRAGGGSVSAGMPYWVGENGPERFIPNTAGNIAPSGGGGVVINNYAQAKVTANRRQSGGGMNWEVLIEPLEAMMAGRMSQGKGALAPAFEGNYGLVRQGRR